MKYLLIPAAIYLFATGWFLFLESKLPYFPYQHLFAFAPNHAFQAIVVVASGLSILIDNQKITYVFLLLGLVDLGILLRSMYTLEMQELSEALQQYKYNLISVGYKAIIIGILLESMRKTVIVDEPQKKKKKKRKVKKMVEMEVEEEVEEDDEGEKPKEVVAPKPKPSTDEPKKKQSKK